MQAKIFMAIGISLALLIGGLGEASAELYTFEVEGLISEGGGFQANPFAGANIGDTAIIKYTVDSTMFEITDYWEDPPHVVNYSPLVDFSIEINGEVDPGGSGGNVTFHNDYWVVDSIWAEGYSQSGINARFRLTLSTTSWFPDLSIENATGTWIFDQWPISSWECHLRRGGEVFNFVPVSGSIYPVNAADDACELDINEDDVVDARDFYTSNYEGFYWAYYIFTYYPQYYTTFFPFLNPAELDWNGDGMINFEDVYSPTFNTTNFYWQYRVYTEYFQYYDYYYPNSNCEEPCDAGDGDFDGVCDDIDECPLDPLKSEFGICGCNVTDDPADWDADGVADCVDPCPFLDPDDGDLDGQCGDNTLTCTEIFSETRSGTGSSWQDFGTFTTTAGQVIEIEKTNNSGEALLMVTLGSRQATTDADFTSSDDPALFAGSQPGEYFVDVRGEHPSWGFNLSVRICE